MISRQHPHILRVCHFVISLVLVMSSGRFAAAQQRQPEIGTLTADTPAFLVPDPTRTPLRVLPMGSVVRVLAREGDWYRVTFRDPTLGDRMGYVLASSVRIEPRGAPQPPSAPPGRPQSAAPSTPRPNVQAAGPATVDASGSRGSFWINGLYQTTTSTFSGVSTFPQYVETATTSTAYSIGKSPGIDIGVSGRVAPQFSIGAAVTWLSQTGDAGVAASIPHPFFFNTPRNIEGVAGGLRACLARAGGWREPRVCADAAS